MSNKPLLDSQAYITLSYLTIVVIGMLFDYNYYSRFGINIFEYADVLDFLLAPVKNIQLLLFALGTFAFVWIWFRLDKIWMERKPESYRRFNFGLTANSAKKYRPFIFGFVLISYFYLSSVFYGERVFKNFQSDAEFIEVVFESDQRVIKGKLIGKNTDYIFLESPTAIVKAIPVSSDVQEIIISRPQVNLSPAN
jgi:hypothetical protein